MTEFVTPPIPGSDTQDQLAFNRNIRNFIIQKRLGPDGSNIEHMDSKDLKVVLSAIKDQDAQALSQQRLQLENKAVDDAAQRAREMIPHLYGLLSANAPAPIDVSNVDVNKQGLPFNIPEDPSKEFVVVDTMLEVGSPDESYNVFMDRTQTSKK